MCKMLVLSVHAPESNYLKRDLVGDAEWPARECGKPGLQEVQGALERRLLAQLPAASSAVPELELVSPREVIPRLLLRLLWPCEHDALPPWLATAPSFQHGPSMLSPHSVVKYSYARASTMTYCTEGKALVCSLFATFVPQACDSQGLWWSAEWAWLGRVQFVLQQMTKAGVFANGQSAAYWSYCVLRTSVLASQVHSYVLEFVGVLVSRSLCPYVYAV